MKLLTQFLIALAGLSVTGIAFAADTGASSGNAWGPLGAGLAIGIAAFGGALGQGKTAATALDGIARNPSAADKLFTPMILGLALIESLVIYAFVIAFMVK